MSDSATLDVTAVVAGGDGIAREPSGRVVFVTGAMPGERVVARFTEQRRDFARAVVERVVTPSPDRVEPPCPFVAAGCGGCDWQHVAPEAQPALKRSIVVDALRRIARLEAPAVDDCVALPATGYRTTVRVGVMADGPRGFRHAGSHDLVAVDDCLVAAPAIAARLRDERFTPGADVTLRIGARTGVAGREEVAGHTFQVSDDAFFQIRPDGADVLVRLVGDALQRHGVATVVDLYAGVGLFAATMHDRGFDVHAAVEGHPAAAADPRVNLAGVCSVVEAEVATWPGAPVDAVIADPSRSGLAKPGVAAVLRCTPNVVVLVSCDPAALGRDARLLGDAGYALEAATPVDLFPHTSHVEVVSAFVKSG